MQEKSADQFMKDLLKVKRKSESFSQYF